MAQGKFIGNVNILDLRKATAETVAEIAGVGNANIAIYSPETAGLLAKINFGNLNTSVEMSADKQLDFKFGQTILGRSYFETLQVPVVPVIFGQLVIEPDVTLEMIEKGLPGWMLFGELVCPETLLGAVQSKSLRLIGQARGYPVLKKIYRESLKLDEDYLQSLEDGTELAVLGSLSLPEVLPDGMLEQKLGKLFALQGVLCHAENAGFIKTHLVEGSGPLTVIPAGFEWVEKPLVLDETLLEVLTARKLYCKERIQIEADITAAVLDEYLDAVTSGDMILCPAALKSTLARKCDLLKNRVIFYEGTLWLVDDSQVLQASYLEALEGKLTLVVTGELEIAPEIEAKDLSGRLAKVHNLGELRCRPQQMGVIQARLGLHDGTLVDSTPKVKDSPEEKAGQIGNANYLAL